MQWFLCPHSEKIYENGENVKMMPKYGEMVKLEIG